MQDLEKLGAELLRGPRGDALRSAADSPEARALGRKLDSVAVEKAIRSGDGAQLEAMLRGLLATAEGRALAEKLRGMDR